MNEDKVYIIAVRFQGFHKTQREELWDLIDRCMDDDKADLRFTAKHINNTTKYETEPEFSNEDFQYYRGYIMRNPHLKNQMHIVVSYGLFPTKLFAAIENQFPHVTVSFTASSDDYAASYSNDPQYGHRKIVVPGMAPWITPFDSQRLDDSTLHSIAHFFQNNDLEGKILVCRILEDELPSEHPRKSQIYNPYTTKDDDLKISREIAQKYFPNLKRPERKHTVPAQSSQKVRQSEIGMQTQQSQPQREKKSSAIMKTLKWVFIIVGVLFGLFVLWILSLIF